MNSWLQLCLLYKMHAKNISILIYFIDLRFLPKHVFFRVYHNCLPVCVSSLVMYVKIAKISPM